MKIAYLINQYPKVSHAFIRREILALEKLGHEIHRISIRKALPEQCVGEDAQEAERTESLLAHGLPKLGRAFAGLAARRPLRTASAVATALRLGYGSDRGLLRQLIYMFEAAWLVGYCRRKGVDHIHAHFGTNPAMVALLCRALGGPTFSFTVHGPEEFDRPVALRLREKTESASFVVAISRFGSSQLYRWARPEDWSRIHVVRCGVDEGFLERDLRPPPSDLRFVCVGRLCEQKGQLLLVEAVAVLRDRAVNVELVLAGDGEMRPVIERRIDALGLGSAVRITGWLDGSQVKREILQSKALVLPSFAEGLPVVLMEALALGRPVISTYVAGIPELVEHGRNGWLVPAGDVTALAEAMHQCTHASDESVQAMGRAGRAKVAAAHDVAAEARVLDRLFAAARAGTIEACDTVNRESLPNDASQMQRSTS